MQGNIDFTGSLSGSIAGGSGGLDVTITPTLQSGTKIADYTIDSESGSLYAPPSTINRAQLPLLIIGDELRIDLSNYYTKAETQIELETYQRQMESIDSQVSISGIHRNQIALTFDIDNYQGKLTAGGNITIDENNIISASGGTTWDYSMSEVDTGQKWTDNKSLFVKTFQGQLTISTTNRTWYDLISNLSYMDKVFVMPESYIELSDAIINIPYTSYFSNVGAVVGANFDTPSHTFQLLIGGLPTGTYDYEITLKYTKTSV